ncbi:MAG: hypothetical protein K6F14_03790 [Clostridiales bacterium]|nr:hypothetical protein [Clostridiales bacterium]
MADSKSAYSEASKHYIEVKVPASAKDQKKFDKSKLREAKYNENWKKQMVNLNEIIDQYCPNYTVKEKGEKYVFRGDRYHVQADMVAGYLKIFDNSIKKWVNLDGSVADLNKGEGHYKIKKREEM